MDNAERPAWVTEGVDINVPNVARAYDYALGGYHNFAVDRDFLERLEEALPDLRMASRSNRAALSRVVRWLVSKGIRQFLNIGSGIPTMGNVHEIAQGAAPESRIVYADIDPVAVAHGRAILAGNPRVGMVEGDLRCPADIVNHPEVEALLDLSEPVAVVLFLVLHFIPDDNEVRTIMAELRELIVSGSYLALTHISPVVGIEDEMEHARQLFGETPTQSYLRDREQLADLLTGLELVEPGIVGTSQWRPEPGDECDPSLGSVSLAAVARKP
jgi:hypothetical protein